MKISVVATVALLSLLAVASSAPHPGDHEGPGYQYEQEVQLQTDGSAREQRLMDALLKQDDPARKQRLVDALLQKDSPARNEQWFTGGHRPHKDATQQRQDGLAHNQQWFPGGHRPHKDATQQRLDGLARNQQWFTGGHRPHKDAQQQQDGIDNKALLFSVLHSLLEQK